MQIQNINNNYSSSVSFGNAIFKNKNNWKKYGQIFLSKLDKNNDLKEFIRKNSDKDVIFFSEVQKKDKYGHPFMINFMYQVREKGLKGLFKSLQLPKKEIGSAYVRKMGDNNKLIDDAKITLRDLENFPTLPNPSPKIEYHLGSACERTNQKISFAESIINKLERIK